MTKEQKRHRVPAGVLLAMVVFIGIATHLGLAQAPPAPVKSAASGDDGFAQEIVGDAPFFNVQANAAAVAFSPMGSAPVVLKPGSTALARVRVNPQNGFRGTVALSLQRPPIGIAADFMRSSLVITGKADGYALLQFRAHPQVRPGSYTLQVKGVSGRQRDAGQIFLDIPAPRSTLPFHITLDQDYLQIEPGRPTQVRVSLTRRSGFHGPVTLSLSDDPLSPVLQTVHSPAKIATSFAPSNVTTANHAILRLKVLGHVPEAQYHFMVVATTADGRRQVCPLTLDMMPDDRDAQPVSEPTIAPSDLPKSPPYPLASTMHDTVRIDMSDYSGAYSAHWPMTNPNVGSPSQRKHP